MAEKTRKRDDDRRTRDAPRRFPRAAGADPQEEIGSTSGRTHDQVLDATLDPDEARAAKLKRDRSNLD